MLGAIFGDIAGSVYEFDNTNDYDFPLLCAESKPTDDSYMTLAVTKALTDHYGEPDDAVRSAIVENMQRLGRKHPDAGYGGHFLQWLREANPEPYNSYGNGSAMRAAAAGWLYPTIEETLHAAEITADVTHNHPEGIKGAQAVAACIFLSRTVGEKMYIRNYVTDTFGYDLNRTLDEIRPGYAFYEICQKSVPEAIIAFLEGGSYEDVIRKAVSLGGDSDTIACMAGAAAEPFFGMPETLKLAAFGKLDREEREIVLRFADLYMKLQNNNL